MLRVLAFALVTVPLACAPPAPEGAPLDPGQGACAFDEVPFDPQLGLVLQGATADGSACARLERSAMPVRRGIVWQAVALQAVAGDAAFDVDAGTLAYENSHHNCRDVVTHGDVTLAIDGVGADPDVCFTGAPDDWRLVLTVNGVAHTLLPHASP